MNLSLLVILPLLTAIIILFCKDLKQVRVVALFGSILQCLLVAYTYIIYNKELLSADKVSNFLLEYSHSWFTALNINYHVGVDGISIAMIALTACVVLAGVLVSWKEERMSKEFFFLLMLLAVGAYGFFISLDLFTMFFFLEVAVIPKFLLIGIWGSGKKEYNALKLALMLTAASALVFVGLMGIYFYAGSFNLEYISKMHIDPEVQKIFFPFAFVGFGIFTALFPFHTWVPDGHSSAPTAGSMFLAGISMKLGGYGCLRVATYLMPDAAKEYSMIIVVLATIAIIYGAFATMMQKDLKYINAYSSVSHCGFVLLGIGMLTETSIRGAVLQMVSHGLMTALFFAAIGMIYSKTHTRMVAQLGGLLKVMPFISAVFVIAGLCSLGLPGLSGFVAEMTVFMGSWQNTDSAYRIATILSCASIVVTAVYILRAIGQSIMGLVTDKHYLKLSDAAWYEKFAVLVLVAGIVFIGIAPFILNNLISPATETIIQHITNALALK
ncbi:NADH-quinone oxidoreductase subunit M [Panacibacter ginsenosidivorans]|uniref:NADH-quinone oxidoreductase subunit M n=1 Tax=Panacibacter ginsenosidivorans TaxID=1813871 RepID=A0A5B8V5F7_9BACT|nr:NADH-quinone oxidoreductase subunit M [Panacibacter ginsenosidivorans]QEC66442.1 NADH-quinone oxidoreductase subunit M [Panacibacter ginsenosidivorans]